MGRVLGIALLAVATGAAAADWQPMTGAEISSVLTGARVNYDDGWQAFYASGRTLYNAGRDSWGTWRIEGDRYCSQWPPAAGWACFRMSRDSKAGDVRFEGESGEMTVGRVAE